MKTDCHDCCYPRPVDNQACGCCEGVEPLTPLPTVNRPGLSRLSYRIGTHASFLETMKARLSNSDYPQLAGLTTRDEDDPSLALLDGWATVADVLTFYQERIANEGYLRTATERRSILELARLVGYKLRPGVSSSVFLAYTIDENTEGETTIPAGSRAQSIPGPDELPQSFETSEDLKARARWNNLKPRMTRPQTPQSFNSMKVPQIYLKGINTNLKPNDPLLIDTGSGTPDFYRVKEIEPDAEADRTRVTVTPQSQTVKTGSHATSTSPVVNGLSPDIPLIKALAEPPSLQPANSWRLKRDLGTQFTQKSEAGYRTLGSLSPMLRDTLSTAMANLFVENKNKLKVYALRESASLFGHNHPGTPNYKKDSATGMITVTGYTPPTLSKVWPSSLIDTKKGLKNIVLDPPDKQINPGSWVTIIRPELDDCTVRSWTHSVHQVGKARQMTLSAFGVSSKVTLLATNTPWLTYEEAKYSIDCEQLLRGTTVFTQSEEMELAEEPIDENICGGEQPLELDSFYEGLESGRWVIISGERILPGTEGVRFSELAMLSAVTQDVQEEAGKSRPGEKRHTFIQFAEKLSYCFKRDTVTIHGNVVKATHGETRNEVLGSGDGSKALQSFELKQFPLTHVAAANPSGVDSALKIYVNDLQWHESDSLAGLEKNDRKFITKTDDEQKTTVIFGSGKQGARLPTGVENIRAEYRNGIGKPGNVRAEQISLLASKPLGVKEVINPLRASGGADRENRDQARKSTPLAVMALDRLVSVRDYQDFSRLYAGIGKASAVEISDGRSQLVHVTIAGADDIPIDENSDLFLNLRQALHDFGDPFQPVQLAVRELMFIVISANVQIQPDYQWEPVAATLRTTLLDSFGFEQRELGQDVLLSEVISVMQAVPGVAYVDVDTLFGIPEKIKIAADNGERSERRLMTPEEISQFVNCVVTEWSADDSDCTIFDNGENGKLKKLNQRVTVNLAPPG